MLPMMVDRPDPGWTPWCELFIANDERLRYVDLHAGIDSEAKTFEEDKILVKRAGEVASTYPAWKFCLASRGKAESMFAGFERFHFNEIGRAHV